MNNILPWKQFGRIFKFILFAIVCMGFMLQGFLLQMVGKKNWLPKLLHYYCQLLTRILQVKVKKNDISVLEKSNYLIVSNHMSYLDVLIISSVVPTRYITSVEMKLTPFLGHLCRLAGCLFVERRSRGQLGMEISEITQSLLEGQNVTIFPEATSTNGEQILKFKRPLLKAAINAQTPLLPVTINYLKVDNQRITSENKDLLCWYGDMEFFDHFWKLLFKNKIELELIFHPVFEITSDMDETFLATTTQKIISEKFIPTNYHGQKHNIGNTYA